jgi:hypothetical protein
MGSTRTHSAASELERHQETTKPPSSSLAPPSDRPRRPATPRGGAGAPSRRRWLAVASAGAAVLAAACAAAYGAFAWGPLGLRAEYARLVSSAASRTEEEEAAAALITEADLARLPAPVRRYLDFAGVRAGQPRPRSFRAKMAGRIRSADGAPWMPFEAEQHSTLDPPRRYFFMRAKHSGLPIDGLHAYDERGATMQIRLLSVFPVVDLKGPALTRTETVTVLNDMAIMAPPALADPAVRWREIDESRAEAAFRSGPHEVRAVLVFDPSTGALSDFWSDDRPALAADGATLQPQRWSTPVGGYRQLQEQQQEEEDAARCRRYRIASHGEARYEAPSGDFAYAEFNDIEVTVQ